MNKKNFKSEYDNYMKDIKPSADLIQKTLKLANEEQQRLQNSKERSSLKLLCSINFKRVTALACTLVFAIFAVKLWNDIDKQPIPVSPNLGTETTTESTYIESTTTTVFTDVQSNLTGKESTNNVDSSSYITSSSDSIPNDTTSQTTSIVYNNENIPYHDVTTNIDNPTETSVSYNMESNNMSMPTNSIISSSTSVTNNDITSIGSAENNMTTKNSITTTTTTFSSYTTVDDVNGSIGGNPSPDIDISVSTTTLMYADTTSAMEFEPTLTDEDFSINTTYTTSATYPMATTTEDFVATATQIPSITVTFEETTSKPALGETTSKPALEETTHSDIDVPSSPDASVSTKRRYIAIRVTLINSQGGFYEDGTIYTNRIMDYLTYGSELTCVIPLGKTNSQDCDCIIVFDYQSVFTQYSTDYSSIANDLNNYYYSKIEIVETPDETNIDEYIQFERLNKNLDLNENNISIDSDIEDRNLFLDLLTIDDTPLS